MFRRVTVAMILLLLVIPAAVRAGDPSSLPAVSGEYPRVFFFRGSEGAASNPRVTYERWERDFSRLMGIEGKVLDEEIPGRSVRNIEFFTRMKRRNPQQLVLLHYNGNSRDPRYELDDFFAGHFLYHNGATILADVPAEEGEAEIKVSDPDLFRTEMGRYRWSNDDIGLCMLDEQGRPDWHESEQTQLVSIDRKNRTIRVRRGCYGSRPMAFPAGSYAAAHATEGPWGDKSNLLWYYNYATVCPKDKQGRTCSDIHAAVLAKKFLPGGELEAFDGLEFDVLHHEVGGGGKLGADCNADGQIDNGIFDGRNEYGIGVVEFCRDLRRKMGPDRLILADGFSLRNQRAFRILNGIESEGWPALNDWEIEDWSGGLNRHWYWAENGAEPIWNYINHKFTMPGEKPGQQVTPEVPFKVHRLVFAAAMFTDSAICYSFAPRSKPGELIGIWDEFWKGEEQELGWLGRPLGPAVRLAEKTPNLLKGNGLSGLAKVSADDATVLRLADVPCDGPDLFVSIRVSGEHRAAEPAEIARRMWVGIAPPDGQLVRADMPAARQCVRGGTETELAPDSGAALGWAGNAELGGQRRRAYRGHPPYHGKTGYVAWWRDVTVPQDGKLEFSTGMGEKSPERSDGVWFQVLVAPLDGEQGERFTMVFEHSQKEFEWKDHVVPLVDWAGKRVRLKFVADCGPKDNATTDHAYWGDAVLVGPKGKKGWTDPVQHMTWVGDRPFTSGFYFRDVRGDTVNLDIAIEGPEPVRIESIEAYAAPDAIYREFERGIVLANPSPRPYTFDLAKIAPGRTFRRIRGTELQDTEANNGQPVGAAVTLDGKEGLFLVRVEE
jgi:hypothetical protein